MNTHEHRAEAILAAAIELPDPAARRAYLDGACAGDEALRQEVESLLAAHEQASGFMNTAAMPGAKSGMPAEKAGDRIGRYKLLEQIGEGGFGVVWMAEQEEPVRRRVALKIIKLGMDTKEVVARFEAERQALALMDHPNIAKVFDGGATDRPLTPSLSPARSGGEGARRAGEGDWGTTIPAGRPYFVMELVKGIPITEYCDAAKLTTPERLGLFMQVCQAVQHAHQKGVIHRDLKSSNVLVTVQDDRPVPKVIDFGVAKATQARLTEKTLFTRFNQWIGTPAYMSPEQAGLGSLDVDTRSDVYSLGVLLYELLTGRPPFDTQKLLAAGYDAVMRTIREEEPPKPSTRLSTLAAEELSAVAAKRGAEPAKLGRLVRGDLDWIVMKALEKDRARRYATASDFAQDLERYLRQEPVSAAAPTAGYRLAKFARRNRVALATTAVVTLSLLTATIVSLSQARRASREAARALRFAAETEAGAYATRVYLAGQRLEEGDVLQADRLLEACPAPLRKWEWHYLKRQCAPDCRVLEGHSNEVARVTASPDGRWLASLGTDGQMLLWDLKGDLTRPARAWPASVPADAYEHKLRVGALAFSHDSRVLACVRPRSSTEWNLGLTEPGTTNSGRELPLSLRGQLDSISLSFSSEDRLLMIGDEFGEMHSFDVQTGREMASHEMFAHAFSADGRRVVSLGVEQGNGPWDSAETVRELRFFESATGRPFVAITNLAESGVLFSVALSPEGDRVAAGFAEMRRQARGPAELIRAEQGWIVVWDLGTRAEVFRYRLEKFGPTDLAFSPSGQRLAVACAQLQAFGVKHGGGWLPRPGKLLILDARSGEEEWVLRGHTHDLSSVRFVSGDSDVASGSSDRNIRLWHLGARSVIPLGGKGSVGKNLDEHLAAYLSPDGRTVAVGTLSGAVDVLDLANGGTLGSTPFDMDDVAMSGSASELVCLTSKALHGWSLAKGRVTWSLGRTNLPIPADRVACSPAGRRIALANRAGFGATADNFALLESGTGRVVAQPKLPMVFAFGFSPDGRFAYAGDCEAQVHLWNAQTGNHQFSRTVAEPTPGASAYDVVKRKTVAWGDLRIAIPVTAVAASPDGKSLAASAGMRSAELRLWDINTGERKWTVPFGAAVSSLTFSPDGARLAATYGWFFGSSSGVVIYDVASGQELLRLDRAVESLAFSPDGARLWGVTPNRSLVYWDATPWPSPVNPPAVASRPSVVESREQEDARLALKTVLRTLDPGFSGQLAILPGAPRLALAGHDGAIRVLQLPGGEPDQTLTAPEGNITSLAASQDGHQLFAATDRGSVFVWSNLQEPPKRVSATNHGYAWGLAASPDGSRAVWVTRRASTGSGEELVAVDVASGRRLWSSEVRSQDARVASFSGDGRQLAVVQRRLVLLDADRGSTLHSFVPEDLPAEWCPVATAMSQDGRSCAAGYACRDGWFIELWDTMTGQSLRRLEAHRASIVSLVFSPDSSRLASGSIDGTARVWDIATGAEIGRVRFAEPHWPLHVSISDDGRWLAAGRDGEFAVVDMPSQSSPGRRP